MGTTLLRINAWPQIARTPHVLATLVVLVGTLLCLRLAEGQSTRSTVRPSAASRLARPPVWDERLLQLFFPDARAAVGPGQAPRLTATPSVRPATPSSLPATEPVESGFNWSELIDRDGLEDEVKALAQSIRGEVATPTRFKSGGYQVARREFSMLAVLFGVIADYGQDVRWQREASGLRDLFARAGFNCKVASDASFKEAALRDQDLDQLVRGGSIDAGPAETVTNWPSLSDRRPLMSRLEQAQRERLESWLANEQQLNQHRVDVLHEAQIVALLSHIIEHEAYEYGDDETYRGYSSQLRQGARELLDAARQGNFNAARAGLNTINQSCDQCHANFRS